MRIERTGQTEALTPKIIQFLEEELSGISLDDENNAEILRPDYTCLRGLMAVEIKSLEETGSGRMENLNNQFRQRSDWPVFFGKADVSRFAKHTDDPDHIMHKATDRAGRAIKNHLSKAHKQLQAHQVKTQKPNLLKLVILINEDNQLYHPDLVRHVSLKELNRKSNGELTRRHVDAVLYLTERHATLSKGKLVYPILIIEGNELRLSPWKSDLINFVIEKWSKWDGKHKLDAKIHPNKFETIEDVPEVMARSDWWRVHYRRNPYLRSLSNADLKEKFEENKVYSLMYSLKDCPFKPPETEIHKNLERFTHLLEEINHRGMCMTELQSTRQRMLKAAQRLGLSQEKIAWVSNMLKLSKLKEK